MAVYTHLNDEEISELLAAYPLGELVSAVGITAGVENSNSLLTLSQDGEEIRYILTLFEARTNEEELPFFIGLKQHLHKAGIPCPEPMARKDGTLLSDVKGRKALIVSFLEGRSRSRISPAMCASLGAAMAQMHLAVEGFDGHRPNLLALEGWQAIAANIGSGLNDIQPALADKVQAELAHLAAHWPSDLPRGIIHADLFPDNVFFEGEDVTGLIDFYFACEDFFAYDLAICLNCWCFEYGAEFNITKAQALLRGYDSVKPFTQEERETLPLLARGAALRFLLTRAEDWLNPREDAQVRPKDPMEYVKKLAFHQQVKQISEYGL